MEFINKIGYAVCHQLPERSIFIDGKQLPVCARDTGIYIGSFISLLFILISKRRKTNAIPVTYISVTFVFFMLLMAVDAVSSYLGFRDTANSIRLLTGLLVGISLPFFIYPILVDNLLESQSEDHILKTSYELIILLFLVTSLFLLILHFNAKLYYPISYATVIGIFSLHYLMFSTMLSLFFYNLHFKRKIIKSFLIFLPGFVFLFIEFISLTKLHNLVNK